MLKRKCNSNDALKLCVTCGKLKTFVTAHNCSTCLNFGSECSMCHRAIIPFDQIHEVFCRSCKLKHQRSFNPQVGGSYVGNIIHSHIISNNILGDVNYVFTHHRNEIENYIYNQSLLYNGIKVSSCVSMNFAKLRNGEIIHLTGHFRIDP